MRNTNTNYDEQYNRLNEQDDDVQFRTVDDILAYYADRHGAKESHNEKPLN